MEATLKDGILTLKIDKKTAESIAENITELEGEISNGARALGSVLQQGVYELENEFRQPPHAFDEHAPKQPSIED
ncbi:MULTISPECIES: hypothetical protein [unclassified Thioalkalivibrio]|jgi:hypothetical protein|uniref:hypothetical protein n=1 Tax=unclassified Thioalkalivibrio TaxID=2621013 RepID=UPI00019591FD|nr:MULTISPECIES: hypothetical protein [unclassified Thioalkalivibrio]ADC72362.1 conserved hypothetical protein [Thioalkalivibrio sp. K90mix]